MGCSKSTVLPLDIFMLFLYSYVLVLICNMQSCLWIFAVSDVLNDFHSGVFCNGY